MTTSEVYMFTTKISKGVLKKVEEVSSIRWFGGERPTEWYPRDISLAVEGNYIVLCYVYGEWCVDEMGENGPYCLAYGDPLALSIVTEEEFVYHCARLMPKG